jgi:hypothetical protein
MRGLGFRRHHSKRARRRALRYLRWLWASDPGRIAPKSIARHAVDRTPCSCSMCVNPRWFLGEPARGERIAAQLAPIGDPPWPCGGSRRPIPPAEGSRLRLGDGP